MAERLIELMAADVHRMEMERYEIVSISYLSNKKRL